MYNLKELILYNGIIENTKVDLNKIIVENPIITLYKKIPN